MVLWASAHFASAAATAEQTRSLWSRGNVQALFEYDDVRANDTFLNASKKRRETSHLENISVVNTFLSNAEKIDSGSQPVQLVILIELQQKLQKKNCNNRQTGGRTCPMHLRLPGRVACPRTKSPSFH
jgi:hypothetical protein